MTNLFGKIINPLFTPCILGSQTKPPKQISLKKTPKNSQSTPIESGSVCLLFLLLLRVISLVTRQRSGVEAGGGAGVVLSEVVVVVVLLSIGRHVQPSESGQSRVRPFSLGASSRMDFLGSPLPLSPLREPASFATEDRAVALISECCAGAGVLLSLSLTLQCVSFFRSSCTFKRVQPPLLPPSRVRG